MQILGNYFTSLVCAVFYCCSMFQKCFKTLKTRNCQCPQSLKVGLQAICLTEGKHIIAFYNAITQNNRKIDRVDKNELYLATVSKKQNSVDGIKTALQFWFYTTQISARMTSKASTRVTSISAVVMKRYI